MKTIHSITKKEWRDLGVTLMKLEIQAKECGFHKTSKKINEAIQEIGWEIAQKVRKAKEKKDVSSKNTSGN